MIYFELFELIKAGFVAAVLGGLFGVIYPTLTLLLTIMKKLFLTPVLIIKTHKSFSVKNAILLCKIKAENKNRKVLFQILDFVFVLILGAFFIFYFYFYFDGIIRIFPLIIAAVVFSIIKIHFGKTLGKIFSSLFEKIYFIFIFILYFSCYPFLRIIFFLTDKITRYISRFKHRIKVFWQKRIRK